jgi:hypothetical protein
MLESAIYRHQTDMNATMNTLTAAALAFVTIMLTAFCGYSSSASAIRLPWPKVRHWL